MIEADMHVSMSQRSKQGTRLARTDHPGKRSALSDTACLINENDKRNKLISRHIVIKNRKFLNTKKTVTLWLIALTYHHSMQTCCSVGPKKKESGARRIVLLGVILQNSGPRVSDIMTSITPKGLLFSAVHQSVYMCVWGGVLHTPCSEREICWIVLGSLMPHSRKTHQTCTRRADMDEKGVIFLL